MRQRSRSNHLLRKARFEYNWSTLTAAENAGISHTAYLDAELGRRTSHPGTREAICRAYGKTAKELGFVLPRHPRRRTFSEESE